MDKTLDRDEFNHQKSKRTVILLSQFDCYVFYGRHTVKASLRDSRQNFYQLNERASLSIRRKIGRYSQG